VLCPLKTKKKACDVVGEKLVAFIHTLLRNIKSSVIHTGLDLNIFFYG